MLDIKSLKSFGADTDTGLKLCLDNEEFYLGLVKSVISDSRVFELLKYSEANDVKSLFETAHALKGMYGNLSLTPIYEPLCELTELTRDSSEISGRCKELIQEIEEQSNKLSKLTE